MLFVCFSKRTGAQVDRRVTWPLFIFLYSGGGVIFYIFCLHAGDENIIWIKKYCILTTFKQKILYKTRARIQNVALSICTCILLPARVNLQNLNLEFKCILSFQFSTLMKYLFTELFPFFPPKINVFIVSLFSSSLLS